MTIKFTGDEFTATQRVLTGCYSLDQSLADHLGNIGWPLRNFVEIYGPKNCGKTTFCLSIMGIVASHLGRDIAILDWEGQNRSTVEGVLSRTNFDGVVDYVKNIQKATGKKEYETGEETAKRFALKLYSQPQPVALIDSLGAYRPSANMEGDLGDANMGVFARHTGRFADWMIAALQRSPDPSIVLGINHLHPTIGSHIAGQDTAGGEKKKFLAQLRINLKRTFLKTNKDPDDKASGSVVDFGDSWLLGGRIDSSRTGFSKREFNVFMIAGEGIHRGLTAVFDCIVMGLAEVSSKTVTKSVTISLDGKSYKLRSMIEHRDDDEQFYPFLNTLMAGEVTQSQPEKKMRGRKKKK